MLLKQISISQLLTQNTPFRCYNNLNEVLVDADETANVATGHAGDGLDRASHHQDGPLNVLHIQIILLAVHVVGA